jgi:hypothetical protein
MDTASSKNRFPLTILALFFICVVNPVLLPNPHYDNNPNIRLAHQQLYSLRLVTSEGLLREEEKRNPGNGYITFYRLYGEITMLVISNSPEEFRQREQLVNKYLKILKELPDNSPDYRLLLGEAYVLTGLVNVKYDNEFSGLIDCLKGYRLLDENDRKYPGFEPDNKMLGIIEIGASFLPGVLKKAASLFNIASDPLEGLKRLQSFSEFAKGNPGYEEEALFFSLGAFRLMNREESAMTLIHSEMDNFKDCAILNFLAATVSVQANDAETALKLLSNINPGRMEIDFPPLLYLTGKTKLMRLDNDADSALLSYLKKSPGSDYLKTILYDLACFNYMSGNTSRYLSYREQVKEKGRAFISRDVEAEWEAGKPNLPDIHLMRADYLARGGYFIDASEELSKIDNINLLKENEQVHYFYLKGECHRSENIVREAESDYLNAVSLAKNSRDHFAQKALANSGMMMEKNSLRTEAEKYYNLCLQFKASDNPYSSLYKNKARAGLIRLSFSQ